MVRGVNLAAAVKSLWEGKCTVTVRENKTNEANGRTEAKEVAPWMPAGSAKNCHVPIAAYPLRSGPKRSSVNVPPARTPYKWKCGCGEMKSAVRNAEKYSKQP